MQMVVTSSTTVAGSAAFTAGGGMDAIDNFDDFLENGHNFPIEFSATIHIGAFPLFLHYRHDFLTFLSHIRVIYIAAGTAAITASRAITAAIRAARREINAGGRRRSSSAAYYIRAAYNSSSSSAAWIECAAAIS